MKKIVVYTSRYGSTEKYACWIGQALGCRVEKLSAVKASDLCHYDMIIYGGGLYAGGISGFKKFLAKLESCQRTPQLLLFMVGITDPDKGEIYRDIADRNIPARFKGKFKPFALRGDQIFSRMGLMHKTMMRMPKAMALKKPEAERTEEDRAFIENYGKDVVFANQESIQPLLNYVRSMEK